MACANGVKQEDRDKKQSEKKFGEFEKAGSESPQSGLNKLAPLSRCRGHLCGRVACLGMRKDEYIGCGSGTTCRFICATYNLPFSSYI